MVRYRIVIKKPDIMLEREKSRKLIAKWRATANRYKALWRELKAKFDKLQDQYDNKVDNLATDQWGGAGPDFVTCPA